MITKLYFLITAVLIVFVVICAELGAVDGIWISHQELMSLPTSGSAWNKVLSAAESSWGSACLGDNDCQHDVKTLAGALVAARLNDTAMRNKTIAGLQSAMHSSLSRALELARGLQSYIIAADIIGYRTPEFEQWIQDMLNADIQGHSGDGILGTAFNAPNNWGGHARASVAAAAIYSNDEKTLNKVVNAHKEFIGYKSVPNTMVYQDTNWHAESDKAGVNRKGTTISGKVVSGVLPEDWRRGAEFAWPPTISGYMWEGMQGFVVTAVILRRAGKVVFNDGDNAVVRAMDMLYGQGEAAQNSPVFRYPAEGDDTWIPWVVNYYAGTNYPADSTSPGKGMGYTDWTHAGVPVNIVVGDLTGDGLVDILDLQACVNHVLGMQDYGATADVNGDGQTNVLDIQLLVGIILGN